MSDTRWNSRGSKFMKWIKQHNLINLINKTLGQHGIPTFVPFKNNQVETSIVDYFITNTELTNAKMEIKANLSFSDHKMICKSFDLDYANNNDEIATTKECIQTTDITNKLNTFLERVKSSQVIQDSPDTKESIDYYTNIIYDDIIYKALDTALGNKEYRNKNWKCFWSKELQHTANTRQYYYNKWIRAYGIAQKCKWWDLYIKQQAKLKQEVKQARSRKSYFDFVDRIDQAKDGDPKTIKRILKSKSNNQQSKLFSSPQGPQHATDQMCDFFESIYDGKYITNDLHIQPRETPEDTGPQEQDAGTPFSQADVRSAIRRLPNKMAPGCDHIIAEHLKPI